MLEWIAAAARWFQLAANLIILGSCVFLAIADIDKRAYSARWVERLERLFPKLAISIVLGLVIILATTIGQITGDTNNLLQPNIWFDFIKDTRTGQIWLIHISAAILLLLSIAYLRSTTRNRWRYIFCAVIAMLPLVADAMVSHTAADGLTITGVLPYALHIIFAGVWLGGLPALLLLKYEYVKQVTSQQPSLLDIKILKRFSSMALPVMLLIVATGLVVADQIFEGFYAALVATPYGWLLIIKLLILAVILIIATRVRSYWLPLFSSSNNAQSTQRAAIGMRKWVRIEYLLAMLLLLVATVIANNATPAKHVAIEDWPFPFRFSIIANWGAPDVALQVWGGLVIVLLALYAIQYGRKAQWNLKRLVGIPAVLLILGLGTALPPLAIEAYPETYRKSSEPFDAVSIAYGGELYSEYCVECHGHQGKGDGIKARTLSTILPDLLTEPHTAEHTPGDFYHWITYGMKGTDMPDYADKLSREERWDLVNYLYALSRGYQSRILSPEIIPDRQTIQPPGFFYAAHNGDSGILQDFRKKNTVLLVFFSWPQSQTRIDQLKQHYEMLAARNLTVLAVPSEQLSADELTEVTENLPFPVVTQGAQEIADSYALYRRTMSRPDLIGKGTTPDHMEFLIDRFGYLRARWIPSAEEQPGWDNIKFLAKQVELLNNENLVSTLPADYLQ